MPNDIFSKDRLNPPATPPPPAVSNPSAPHEKQPTADDDHQRLRSADPDAVAEFVRREMPKVFRLAVRLCRTTADAEDLCQDVFVRAIKGLKKFQGNAALSTWLHRITVNTWKNRLRHDTRRRAGLHTSIDEDAEDGARPPHLSDPRPTPDEAAGAADEVHAILRSLDRLEVDERAILVLRDIEERTYEEIALILKLNLGTVKSRISRAREALRRAHRAPDGGRA